MQKKEFSLTTTCQFLNIQSKGYLKMVLNRDLILANLHSNGVLKLVSHRGANQVANQVANHQLKNQMQAAQGNILPLTAAPHLMSRLPFLRRLCFPRPIRQNYTSDVFLHVPQAFISVIRGYLLQILNVEIFKLVVAWQLFLASYIFKQYIYSQTVYIFKQYIYTNGIYIYMTSVNEIQ